MKAKEYADRYTADPTIQTLWKIGHDFLLESKTLVEQRHASKNEALFAILNELDLKWQAFARMVDGGTVLRPDGFRRLVKERLPELYPAWVEYREQTGS